VIFTLANIIYMIYFYWFVVAFIILIYMEIIVALENEISHADKIPLLRVVFKIHFSIIK